MFINYLKYTQLKKTCHNNTAGLSYGFWRGLE